MLAALATAILRATHPAKLANWKKRLPIIAGHQSELSQLSESDVRRRSLSLRYRAKSREPLDRLLPEAYALVQEAARRSLGMSHFDVQLLGGIALHHQSVIEMQTGEGKTLTATLPVYLNALLGRGTHVATANPYLARRDAEWMKPVYELLGMTVGVVQPEMSQADRRREYAADITYGTTSEFGFDFLRDRLLLRQHAEGAKDLVSSLLATQPAANDQPVQREAYFVLVDEADSLLIDGASTPLFIQALSTEADEFNEEAYRWSALNAHLFEQDEHYSYDVKTKSVELTAGGRELVRTLPKPAALDPLSTFRTYDYVERAIRIQQDFVCEQQYVVRDGEVVIIDEYSGRLAEGMKWRGGVHQAVEAKEGLPITAPSGCAARITVQHLFRRYEKLAGMTGTALDSARELRKVYKLAVVSIPTHRAGIRQRWPYRIYGSRDHKWAAIVEEVEVLHAQDRPVLIGTRSIDKSEELSRLLTGKGIDHQVLNAYKIADEAEIVAAAGQRGKVTVATNMAGRGTDIKLGPGVAELGGLHVILTELNEAARVDRQLVGRCARQGDPGSFREYMALDDELILGGLGPERANFLKALGKENPGPFDDCRWLFHKAQRNIEHTQFRGRCALMHYELQRHKLQRELGQDPYLDAPW